ncbi:MAG: hypothetical protein JXB07_02565 [Anaerolineae bacterium]|nr:hypothetical protein [Anaerolineae bacterium]
MNLTADQLAFIVFSCGALLFVLLVLGVVITIAFVAARIITGFRGFSNAVEQRNQLEETWHMLAERTGLCYRPGDLFNFPSVVGNYRGRPLRLSFFSPRSTHLTIVEILLQNPAGWSLYLQPQDVMDTLGKAIGLRDIEIGDPAFDQKFRIGSTPPDAAARMLANDTLRTMLLTVPLRQFALEGDRLYYAVHRLEIEIDPLCLLFDRLSSVADEVERAQKAQKAAGADRPQESVFASDIAQPQASNDPFAGRGLVLSTSLLRSIDPMHKAQWVSCLGIVILAAMVWTTVCLAIVAYHLFLGAP